MDKQQAGSMTKASAQSQESAGCCSDTAPRAGHSLKTRAGGGGFLPGILKAKRRGAQTKPELEIKLSSGARKQMSCESRKQQRINYR